MPSNSPRPSCGCATTSRRSPISRANAIATTAGTTAHVFLNTAMKANNLAPSEVELLNQRMPDAVTSVISGACLPSHCGSRSTSRYATRCPARKNWLMLLPTTHRPPSCPAGPRRPTSTSRIASVDPRCRARKGKARPHACMGSGAVACAGLLWLSSAVSPNSGYGINGSAIRRADFPCQRTSVPWHLRRSNRVEHSNSNASNRSSKFASWMRADPTAQRATKAEHAERIVLAQD
jgi:hypothetical protein